MSKAANGSGTVYKPKHPSKNLPFRAEVWITDNSRPEGRRRISKNFKKRSQAEQWRDEMLQKYSTSNNSICDPCITLSQWLTFWLNTFALNIKDSTRTGYECYISQHIAKHPIGSIQLKELNVCDLQSYITYLANHKNLKGGDGLSVKTIRSMILMVRKSLHAAVGANLLDKNPADFIVLHAGAVKMSVFGYDADNTAGLRATTVPVTLNIRQSGFVGDDDSPIPPTPDLYTQILQKIEEVTAPDMSQYPKKDEIQNMIEEAVKNSEIVIPADYETIRENSHTHKNKEFLDSLTAESLALIPDLQQFEDVTKYEIQTIKFLFQYEATIDKCCSLQIQLCHG